MGGHRRGPEGGAARPAPRGHQLRAEHRHVPRRAEHQRLPWGATPLALPLPALVHHDEVPLARPHHVQFRVPRALLPGPPRAEVLHEPVLVHPVPQAQLLPLSALAPRKWGGRGAAAAAAAAAASAAAAAAAAATARP